MSRLVDYESPSPRPTFADRMPYGWEYLLPMAVFLFFVWLGGQDKAWFPWCYAARTLIVGGLLVWLWPRFTKVRWTHLGLGAVVGVVGLVQWIGMELAFISLRDAFPKDSLGHNLLGFLTAADLATAFVIPDEIPNPALMAAFIAVRWLGPTLVVPVLEELFWRDWLWRSIAAPNDFRMVEVGVRDRTALWGVPLAFALVHLGTPVTAVVWGLLVGWLLWRTKSLGACIVAHAVTNFLLGGYVLLMWAIGRPQWFFW